MLIMPSFKKSLIVEQFQGNYLKPTTSPIKALKEVMGYLDIPQTTAPRESLARKKKKLQKL